MKNRILLSLMACILALSSFGQDIIVKQDGNEIQSKILEITSETIKYKKFEFQDGPTRNIEKSEVFMIIYENGKREKFKKKPQTEKSEKLENDKQSKEAYYESSKKYKNVLSQGLYINIQGGYDFALSTQNLDGFLEFYNYTSEGSTTTREQIFVSFGKGFNFGGAVGYMFNENFGAEIGVSYLIGAKSEATIKDYDYSETIEYTFSSKMLRINPSLIISSGLGAVNPYAKFGLIIGTGNVIWDVYAYDYDYDDVDEATRKLELNEGLAVGLNAAFGLHFTFGEHISIFAEANMINMSYAPEKGEITEYTENGENQLYDMTTSEKEIEFVKEYTSDYNNPSNEHQPSKALKQKLPFGSIGGNIGVKISF